MSILDKKIEKADSICILGHKNPDGDCIGSMLAVFNYIINKYGDTKKVRLYNKDLSNRFMILKNADKISDSVNDGDIYDLAIVLDSSDDSRFPDFSRYLIESKDSIGFDHHENSKVSVKEFIVDRESIATCELLYNYLDKKYVDKEVAKCLYIGIATDSGVFRYRQTSKNTFMIVSELIEYGFNFTELLDKIVFDNTVNQRKAQAIAFDRLKIICKGQVSFSYILDSELDELNISKADIDNIIVYLREIVGIKVAAFAYPTGNNIYKFSLRSKTDTVDVAEFARMHEGGGHKLAAGCVYYGDIKNVANMFELHMSEFLS